MEKAKLRWKLNKKGKKVYYLVVTSSAEGERWERIGPVSKKIADDALALANGEIAKKKFKLPRDQKIVPFGQMAEVYLQYSKTNNSPRTYDFDKRTFKTFLNFECFKRPIHEIGKEQIEEYKACRLSQHSHIFVFGEKTRKMISKATVNRELNALSAFFRIAKEYGTLEQVPDIQKFTLDKNKKDFLRLEEVFAIYKECTPWADMVFTFFLNTGARKSEITNLKLSALNFENATIKLFGKGAKERMVDMTEVLFDLCTKLKTHYMQPDTFEWTKRGSEHTYIFCHDDGKPMTSIARPIKRAARRAGINRRIYLHLLRHTFGTQLVHSGVDLRTIQELMGHESIVTTEGYVHADRDHQKRSMKKLPYGNKPAEILEMKKKVQND